MTTDGTPCGGAEDTVLAGHMPRDPADGGSLDAALGFDQLLPFLGERLIAHVSAKMDPSLTGTARERARFLAYFDFCRRNPGFLRILNEAEVFAPTAYHRHVVMLYEGYLK